MSQNISTAVMQRRVEAHDSLDDFPTPPWATRALCEYMGFGYHTESYCRDPAANRGHMVGPLREYFIFVDASDVHDYGYGFAVADYLFPVHLAQVGWTITNPPFRLAQKFVLKALEESSEGVAVIVRTGFLEGQGRYAELFKTNPPSHVLQFTERVVMHKGKLSADGSTATAYCWIVWRKNHGGPTLLDWIPPCRKRLERAEDYA